MIKLFLFFFSETISSLCSYKSTDDSIRLSKRQLLLLSVELSANGESNRADLFGTITSKLNPLGFFPMTSCGNSNGSYEEDDCLLLRFGVCNPSFKKADGVSIFEDGVNAFINACTAIS
jgi:hypothetical protein